MNMWNGEISIRKPTQRGHVRRHAMLWDDLVSVVRNEIMRSERNNSHPSSSCFGHRQHDINCYNTSNTSSCGYGTNPTVTTQLSDVKFVPNESFVSPPRVKRLPFCFDSDSSTCDVTASSWEEGPKRLKIPPKITKMPPVCFDVAKTTPPTHSVRHLDSDEDIDDTSSLEYSSDDDSTSNDVVFSSAAGSVVYDGQYCDVRCSICLEDVDSSNVATLSGCGHGFCFDCIDQWTSMRNECPLCKAEIHLIFHRTRQRSTCNDLFGK